MPYDGNGSAWARVRSLRNNYRAVQSWLDVPGYIDFMIVWMFGRCEDEYRCVGPMAQGSGFKFYLNDADGYFHSPANPWYGEPSQRTFHSRSAGRLPGDGPGSLFSALRAEGDPDYRILLADRIYRTLFNNGALTPDRNAARLKARCEQLEKAFVAESVRWAYRAPADWASVRDDVARNWLPGRTEELVGELRAAGFYPKLDAPELNQQGGVVTNGFRLEFTAPAKATVFYTLDGSDPRLPGGAAAPSARSYSAGQNKSFASGVSGQASSPLVLTQNTVVKARAQAGTQWSALNEAFFQTGAVPFDASDLHVEAKQFENADGRRAEFIELSNSSSRAVNLRGAQFSPGIRFSFSNYEDTVLAPGQKLVLVRDLFHYRQRFGPQTPVAGVYTGTPTREERISR